MEVPMGMHMMPDGSMMSDEEMKKPRRAAGYNKKRGKK